MDTHEIPVFKPFFSLFFTYFVKMLTPHERV